MSRAHRCFIGRTPFEARRKPNAGQVGSTAGWRRRSQATSAVDASAMARTPANTAEVTIQVEPLAMLNVDSRGNVSSFSPELLGLKNAQYADYLLGNIHTHSLAQTLASKLYAGAGHIRFEEYELIKAFRGQETHDAIMDVPVLANNQHIPTLAAQVDVLLDQGRIWGYLIEGHGLSTIEASSGPATGPIRTSPDPATAISALREVPVATSPEPASETESSPSTLATAQSPQPAAPRSSARARLMWP